MLSHPWLINQSGVGKLQMLLQSFCKGETPKGQSQKQAMQRTGDGVAIINVYGVLAKDESWWPDTSYEDIADQVTEAVQAKEIKGIFLAMDSPGGSSLGNPEISELVAKVAKKKPIVAYTDVMIASAAYSIAAGATAIYASKSSYSGSIGTYTFFTDFSGMLEKMGIKVEVFHNIEGDLKTTWLPYSSLTEEQKLAIQSDVEKSNLMFSQHVTKYRNLSEGSMRGQVFLGPEAKDRGLIDQVASREEAYQDLIALMS